MESFMSRLINKETVKREMLFVYYFVRLSIFFEVYFIAGSELLVLNSTNCMENTMVCHVDKMEIKDIKEVCDNKSTCTRKVTFQTECQTYQNLVFYEAHHHERTQMENTTQKKPICQPVNQSNGPCTNGNARNSVITFHPKTVETCLTKNKFNHTENWSAIDCKKGLLDDMLNRYEQCLTIPQRIEVDFSCIKRTVPTNQVHVSTTIGRETNDEPKGAIIAGLVGGMLILTVIISVIIFIYRRKSVLKKGKQKTDDKSLIHENPMKDFIVCNNVAYSESKGSRPRENDMENCYQDSLMKTKGISTTNPQYFSETDGYCFAKPITMVDNHNRKTNHSAHKIIKHSNKTPLDNNSTNNIYLDFPSEPFKHEYPAVGIESDSNHYDDRSIDTYDTAQNQVRPNAIKTDDANLNYNRVGGTYDTSHQQNRLKLTNQDSNVNLYDLRVSGTYDNSQSQTFPNAREGAGDVNLYDFRISGTYDTSQNVVGDRIKYEDESADAYDHFCGQKDDRDYDHVTKCRDDIGKDANIYEDN